MEVVNTHHGRWTLREFRCCGNLWQLLYNESPRWGWRRRWRPTCDTCGYHLAAAPIDGGQKPGKPDHRGPSFFR